MSDLDVDKARLGYHRVDNTETVSSPHTYAHSKKTPPSSTKPDHPRISHLAYTSAVAGLTSATLEGLKSKKKAETAAVKKSVNEEEEGAQNAGSDGASLGANGFPLSTRRVQTLSFELAGISPPVANLFRRLIVTEVPILAFHRVLITENDGVVLDELLSHRIGLVPVAGPVAKMQYIDEQNPGSFSALDPLRVLVFDLEAEGAKDAAITLVHSSALKWVPLPGQEAWVDEDDKVFLVHPDIILTKLGPGQKLKLRAIAVKGIGAVHTKWSPVSSCYYEMKTSIGFTEPVCGEAAHQLQQLCPETFSINEKDEAVVVDASKYTKVLDCLRPDANPSFADKIKIEKDKTCVRFYLESTGQLPCTQIFRMALQLFAERCRSLSKMIMQTEVHPAEEPAK